MGIRSTLACCAVLTGCLSTPSPQRGDGGGTGEDAAPADANLDRCGDATCVELLAIGFNGDIPNLPGWQILVETTEGVWEQVPAGAGPELDFNDVSWADLTGPGGLPDGVPELGALGYNGLKITRLAGDGSFGAATAIDVQSGTQVEGYGRVSWIDGDGDGDLDGLLDRPEVEFVETTATGWTLVPWILPTPHGLGAGSWDDDDASELVIMDTGYVRVHERGASAWDYPGSVEIAAEGGKHALFCDVIGEEHLDIVVVSNTSVRIFGNRGSEVAGNWIDPALIRDVGVPAVSDPAAACGDLDGDGRDDLVFGVLDEIHAMPHGGTARMLWENPEPGTINGLDLGDDDGDGLAEVWVAIDGDNTTERAAVVVLPNTTTMVGVPTVGTARELLRSSSGARDLDWIAVPMP